MKVILLPQTTDEKVSHRHAFSSLPLGLVIVGTTVVLFVVLAFGLKPAYYRSGHDVCSHFCYTTSEECASPETWADVPCISGVANQCGSTGQSPIDLSITAASDVDDGSKCLESQVDGSVGTQFNVSYCHESFVVFSMFQVGSPITPHLASVDIFFLLLHKCMLSNCEFPSEVLVLLMI